MFLIEFRPVYWRAVIQTLPLFSFVESVSKDQIISKKNKLNEIKMLLTINVMLLII